MDKSVTEFFMKMDKVPYVYIHTEVIRYHALQRI